MRINPIGAAVCMLLCTFLSSTANSAETRVFVNAQCIIADEPLVSADSLATKGFGAGIVASVAEALLSDVIGSIANFLNQSGRARDVVYEASSDLYLYRTELALDPLARPNPEFGCVTLVAGTFAEDGSDCTGQYEPARITDDSPAGIADLRRSRNAANVLRRANICLTGDPDYVFESRVVHSADGSSFRMADAGFEVNQLQSAKRESDARSIVAVYSLVAPSADGRGRLLANTWLTHGDLKAGDRLAGVDATRASNWTAWPALTGAARQAYQNGSEDARTLYADIDQLERGILADSQDQAALDAAAQGASGAAAISLRDAADKLERAIAVDLAKLQARQQALAQIPEGAEDYGLAELRVSITESRSQKAMTVWLADKLRANRRLLSYSLVDAADDD